MNHSTTPFHYSMRGAGLGVVAAAAIWITTLMIYGSQVRSIAGSGVVRVTVGPLLLHTIQKLSLAGGGHTITFTIGTGLWWLFGICMVGGGLGGIVFGYIHQRHTGTPHP